MAAEVLATAGVEVTLLERMPSVGRKLLLAGRGGLNLTHSEPLDSLLDRYGAARRFLEPAIRSFPPDGLRAWCADLGQEPFVGTSGRVFPSGFRATPLLRAWLRRLDDLEVDIRTRNEWNGVLDGVTVLALGGASWPRTGSNGAWTSALSDVDIVPYAPSNCGFHVDWSPVFRERFAGTPVKDVRVTFEDTSSRGDVVITTTGVEGGPIYALSSRMRDADDRTIEIDLRPDMVEVAVDARPKDSRSTALRRAGFAPIAAALLRETGSDDPKHVRLRCGEPMPIDRAISSAGGIATHEVDETFMLRKHPGTFVAGEMLDWEAPTGGYLLQATFSTAVAAARGALAYVGEHL
ncbi:MAG: hypothetical protein QOD30_2370 [Actinomycetota bacterium]|nr:hypothetical protein [Actinomycetota bacterium]